MAHKLKCPTHFQSSWCAWTNVMEYSKASLKRSDDKEYPYCTLFRTGNVSEKFYSIRNLLCVLFEPVLINLIIFVGIQHLVVMYNILLN
jgi:Fe-S-cluster containining protein